VIDCRRSTSRHGGISGSGIADLLFQRPIAEGASRSEIVAAALSGVGRHPMRNPNHIIGVKIQNDLGILSRRRG
jgi:hypothetical protein